MKDTYSDKAYHDHAIIDLREKIATKTEQLSRLLSEVHELLRQEQILLGQVPHPVQMTAPVDQAEWIG